MRDASDVTPHTRFADLRSLSLADGAFCVLTTTAIAVRYCRRGERSTPVGEWELLAPLQKAIPEGWFAALGFPFLDSDGLPHGLRWRLSEHIVYAGLSSQSMELLLACHGLHSHRQLATTVDDNEGGWAPGHVCVCVCVRAHVLAVADCVFMVCFSPTEGLARFRAVLQRAVSEESGQCLVVNYHRGTVKQIPVNNGHMSPVAGYHMDSDKCLILDTNTWRYPPVWVDTKMLWEAMCKRTNIGVPRGFLVVEPPREGGV